MTYRLTRDAILAGLLTAALGNPATAQVYRCQEGDTTVFSDIPCSENAELLEVLTGISVVAAADDLDDVAQRNKAFIDQRQEKLAARRERAAEFRQRTERDRQRRAAAEEIRYRTIVGSASDRGRGSGRHSPTDRRTEAQRRRAAAEDGPERRRTLLSRSGGNQPRILR
jgi:hypothetical protein